MSSTFKNFTLGLLSFLFLTSIASAGSNSILGENPVLGKVGNKKITMEQLNDKDIYKLREKLYTALKQKFMLAAVDEMLKKRPSMSSNKIPLISDKQIADFYIQRGLQSQGTLNQLKPAIKNYLIQAYNFQKIESLYEEGIKKGYITQSFVEPEPWLFKVPIETAFIRGNKNARVIVLEYSDYQCPFCGRVQPTIKKLINEYSGKVAFAYRHFPLGFHEQADEAANAAECAREQGKFAEYHETLFKNTKALQDNDLKRYAQKVGISNMNRFNKCLSSNKYGTRVQHDMKIAQQNGVTGTPAFFIGTWNKKKDLVEGEFLNGAQPHGAFKKLIERYLKKR